MIDWLKKGLTFGLGLAVSSKEQIEQVVNELVKKGELSQEESKGVIRQLIQRGEEEKNQLKHFLREQLRPLLEEMAVATKEDIQKLEQRIEKLEKGDE